MLKSSQGERAAGKVGGGVVSAPNCSGAVRCGSVLAYIEREAFSIDLLSNPQPHTISAAARDNQLGRHVVMHVLYRRGSFRITNHLHPYYYVSRLSYEFIDSLVDRPPVS